MPENINKKEKKMIKRFEISAYCHRCGSAEGSNAVVIDYDEDKNGTWIRYCDYKGID